MDSYFSQITFDAEKHIYTLADQVLTSVTRVIARLQPPFDNDGWARRKAEERGVPVEVVLKEWEQKRLVSQDRGTRVHQHIEQVLRGEQTADPFLALNSLLPEMTAFNKFWQQVSPTVQVKKIEWVVGDGQLGIAGTVDALLYSEATGLYHIWEWKTGQAINSSNRFQTLLAPFSDLDDCKLIVYCNHRSIG